MKFTVLQENLSSALGSAIRMVSSRPQLPVLSNILIHAKKDGLYVTSTDLEMGVVVKVGAKIESEGKVTVPAKMFSEFVSALPAGKVEVELKKEILMASLGSYKAEFQVIGADEYPELPGFDEVGDGMKFAKGVLTESAENVLYAVARDSMRPVLTGVLFEFSGKGLRLVATDGFRLAVQDMNRLEGVEKKGSYVLPSRAISEVLRLMKGGEVTLKFLDESNQAVFLSDDVLIVTQLLDGNFPDYKKIIPDDYKSKLSVSREDLLEALTVSQVFARDNSNVLKWNIGEGKIEITSESPEQGKNEADVNVELDGDGGEIAFNGRFVIEYLQSSDSERVWMGMNESLSPGAFRNEGNEDFLYIVMPINL